MHVLSNLLGKLLMFNKSCACNYTFVEYMDTSNKILCKNVAKVMQLSAKFFFFRYIQFDFMLKMSCMTGSFMSQDVCFNSKVTFPTYEHSHMRTSQFVSLHTGSPFL